MQIPMQIRWIFSAGRWPTCFQCTFTRCRSVQCKLWQSTRFDFTTVFLLSLEYRPGWDSYQYTSPIHPVRRIILSHTMCQIDTLALFQVTLLGTRLLQTLTITLSCPTRALPHFRESLARIYWLIRFQPGLRVVGMVCVRCMFL